MEEWTHQEWMKTKNKSRYTAFYLYTPMCGTCQVTTRMLNIITELLPSLTLGKANLNLVQEVAELYRVESVPCLLLTENGKLREKVYAFQSVPFLYEKLKTFDR